MSSQPPAESTTVPTAPLVEPPEAEPPVDELTQAVEALIDRLEGFAHHSVEELDGFATALACHPRSPRAEVWATWLYEDAFDRCFADPQDAAAAHALLTRWLERIRAELEPERLLESPQDIVIHPYLMVWEASDRAEFAARALERRRAAGVEGEVGEHERLDLGIWVPYTGAVWASAFRHGIECAIEHDPLPSSKRLESAELEAFDMVEGLMLADSGPAFEAYTRRFWVGKTPTRDQMLDLALLAAQELRLMWLEASLTPQPIHTDPKIGRNDPCHCGSGRKFKKCHGAASA